MAGPQGLNRETQEELDHNVKLVYLFTLSFWSARSIVFQQVLSGYVFVLAQSTKAVGIIKGIQGIFQLVFAFPAGYAADHFRRDNILRVAGCLGLVSAAISFVAFDLARLDILYVAFGAWGIFNAFQSPAMEALFADSVPHGQRSRPFTIKYVLMNVALVLGPVVSIVLFLKYGDQWEIPELRVVLLSGTVIAACSIVFLFYFDDDKAHEMKLEAAEAAAASASASSSMSTTATAAATDSTPLLLDYESQNETDIPHGEIVVDCSSSTGTYESFDATTSIGRASTMKEDGAMRSAFGLTSRHVPVLLFISDFIISNGAGMTINFFPVFFMQIYQLSPVQINILFVLQPFCIVVLSLVAQKLSRRVGRMPVVVSTRVLATCYLLWMSYADSLWLQLLLFLMRGGTMRCSQALRRSVLMDHVPRNQRARWNSLEGLTVFSWSGSAVVGGYLIDAYGYRYCFFLTSIVYFVGLLVELLLLPLTHRIEAHCPAP